MARPSGRKPLIAGNWKMNLTHLEAIGLVQKIAFGLREREAEEVEVAVLPPFTAIRSVQTLIEGDKLPLAYGAQDLSAHSSGAYTGEIAGSMLAKLAAPTWPWATASAASTTARTTRRWQPRRGRRTPAVSPPIICVGEPEQYARSSAMSSTCSPR